MNAALRCFSNDIEPLRIRIPDAALRRLRLDLGRARDAGEAWDASLLYGAPPQAVEQLLAYWCDHLDFRGVEARLAQLPLFRATTRGEELAFVHARSPEIAALPLLWLHGYSGSVLEAERVVPLLASDAFHLVLPSLPGFGVSTAGYEPNVTNVAQSCMTLMAQLGYERYVVHGSDLGAGVAAELARLDAQHAVGLHVTSLASLPALDPFELAALASDEKSRLAGLSELQAAWEHASPESAIERLAFAARQLDDTDAQPEAYCEQLLYSLSLSWLGGDHDFQRRLARSASTPAATRSEAPVCVCSFPLAPPTLRRFAERQQRIVEWHEQPHGGELAALERPQDLLDSLRRFFARFR